MKHLITISIIFAFWTVSISAQGLSTNKPNTLFEDAVSEISIFKTGGEWFPYPEYSDREAWQQLAGRRKGYIIKKAESYADYEWQPILASTYLQYEKTGDRSLMEGESKNRMCLNSLVLAELVEGTGRFIPKIVDFLWLETMRYSWNHAQHTSRQASGRTLPCPDDRFIALHTAENAISIAIAYHFFKDEMDRMDPSICKTLLRSIRENVFVPFLDETKYETSEEAFLGLGDKKILLNNWDIYCNYGVLLAFLLMDDNQEEMEQAIRISTRSVDAYLSYIPNDGCCDEGPGYWRMSFGRVYEYSRMLCDASYGKVNVMNDNLLKKMAEYKPYSDLGDGWVVNFSDGSARTKCDAGFLFRIGYDLNDEMVRDYSISHLVNAEKQKFEYPSLKFGEISKCLECLRYQEKLNECEADALKAVGGEWSKLRLSLTSGIGSVRYNASQQCVLRKGDWALAAKGGHNGESHNHNDVGSCILFYDSMPVLVDPGSADYVKDTFGPNRYTLWYNRSYWHNIPVLNGVEQHNGREYASSLCECDDKSGRFRVEFSGAYPEDAAVKEYDRTYTLTSKGLTIVDKYNLVQRKAPDSVNFTLWGDLVPEKGNVIVILRNHAETENYEIKISYPTELKPVIEGQPIDSNDRKMSGVWKDKLWHLRFVSSDDAPLSGTYTFTFVKDSL